MRFKKYARAWPSDETVTILLPVYNEKETIRLFIEEWLNEVLKYLPADSKILIEDGGSTDGTSEILSEISQSNSQVTHIKREKKDGFGNAAKRLLNSVDTDWFFFSDADGQFFPQDFWNLAFEKDHFDLIKGAKLARMDPVLRRINSFLFNKVVNIIFNTSFSDINAGFLLGKREVLDVLNVKKFEMKTMVISELLIKSVLANFYVKQVFVNHRVREHGKSRGVSSAKYFFTGLDAITTLLRIKRSYRVTSYAE